jgi:hypothetical protein
MKDKKKILALIPLIGATIYSGVIFLNTLEKELFTWKFYMSMAGFMIVLGLTLWFSILFYKRNSKNVVK